MEKTRKCPYCGEEIMADARKCKHCGEWLNDEAEPKQPVQETGKKEPESQLRKQPLSSNPVSEPVEKTKSTKPNRTFLIVIAIAVMIALAVGGLFLYGSFGSKDTEPMVVENNVEKDLETQIAEAYRTRKIWDLQTPSFKSVETAMDEATPDGYLPCVDWDYYYGIGDIDLDEDPYDLTRISVIRAEIVGENKAHVYVTLEHEWESEQMTVILVMMRDGQKGKWLVDDVRAGGSSIKEMMINCTNSTSSLMEEEVETKAIIENQILDAFKKGTLYELLTLDFKALDEAVREAEVMSGETFYDTGIFFNSQDDPEVIEISEVSFEEENKARVKVLYGFPSDLDNRNDSTVLIMVRDNQGSDFRDAKWLIDDVMPFYEIDGKVVPYSIEAAMNEFVITQNGFTFKGENAINNDANVLSGKDNGNNGFVVIDGSELRLRLAPSTSSETFKWPDGTNRHPNVGDKFKYLGESGDFYKIDFNGNELWVSKQYTHLEQ